VGESAVQKVIRRAVTERWPISAEQRAKAVTELVDILVDKDKDGRARVRAGQVLVAMDALNLKEEIAEDAAPAVPAVKINVQGEAKISLTSDAVAAFLEDCEEEPPAAAPVDVIEHIPSPSVDSPSPQQS